MTNINTFQGDVFIHEYIKHTGDDNNLFGFSGTDTFKIATAGTDRLTVGSDGAVTVANDLFVNEYIKHSGDTDTNIQFTTDTIVFSAAGVAALNIVASGDMSFGGGLYVHDYIYHRNDNDTFLGFPSDDTFKLRTNGTDRFSIDSAGFALFANTLRASAMGVGVSPSGVALQVSGYTHSDYFVSTYSSFYASRLVGHAVYYLVNKTLMFLWESQNGNYPAFGMQFMWYRDGVGTGSQSIIPPNGPAAYQESGYIKYNHPGPSFSMTWRTIRWN